ncbi:MAG: bifunctional heptose 7-phosphate kinase/heptose 1-phosphate adenyltransferase, partial [Armatimonadota bacterium]
PHRLRQLLARFPDLDLAVVGDFFLDKYLIIDPALAETSLETGLEAYQVVAKRLSPGAAGTVCNNLAALKLGKLRAVGVIGDDGEGYDLLQGLRQRGVDTDLLAQTPDRFTPTYTKPMVIQPDGSEREINRQDSKNRSPLPPKLEDCIIESLRACVPEVHGVVIADQVQERNCGVITDRVRDELAALAQQHSDTVLLADSRVRIGEYRGIMIKPNRREAIQAVRPGHEGEDTLDLARECAQQLAQRNRRPVFLTAGDQGIFLCHQGECRHIPAVKVTGETDIVGAGDSTTAGIVLSLCAGATPEEAALVGNLVASITIQQLGTTGTASPQQVLARLADL